MHIREYILEQSGIRLIPVDDPEDLPDDFEHLDNIPITNRRASGRAFTVNLPELIHSYTYGGTVHLKYKEYHVFSKHKQDYILLHRDADRIVTKWINAAMR